eukprot:TRINITY_DN5071_c0_g1_i3.p2 TRINITY_DN5071_c0_g1~~TRINITY_DN5071_c0_g1_i3.p2  ORF type:complete len:123 (-),score=39.30 TRINITY_DN5071_c0_g1_i3:297-665(-)
MAEHETQWHVTNKLFAIMASLMQEVEANPKSTVTSRKLLQHLEKQLEAFEQNCDMVDVKMAKHKLQLQKKLGEAGAEAQTESLADVLNSFGRQTSAIGTSAVKRERGDEGELEPSKKRTRQS